MRPSGIGRYFTGLFLAVWLCGWTVGEAVACAAFAAAAACLVRMAVGGSVCADGPQSVPGGAAAMFLAIGVWLPLWTIGGVATWAQLLRSLWGEDRLQLVPEGLQLVRRAGPFRRRRTFDRGTIRAIRLRRRDGALVADTAAGIEVLTDLGTIPERTAIRAWLHDGLHLPDDAARADSDTPPPNCDVQPDGAGWRLTRPPLRIRRIQARVAWIVAAGASLAWTGARTDATASLALLSLVALLAAGAAWLSWGRTEWILESGALRFRRRLGTWSREQSFAMQARLTITRRTDSDGDDDFRLVVHAGDIHRTIVAVNFDPDEVLQLGRWLALRTGLPLDIPTGVDL